MALKLRKVTMNNPTPPDRELLPLNCPFCNGKPEMRYDGLDHHYCVSCSECDAAIHAGFPLEDEAFKAWYTRPPTATLTEEKMYPCADCGKLRTKDEGGTTFTVCDECWNKHYKKPKLAKPSGLVPLDRDLINLAIKAHLAGGMIRNDKGNYGLADDLMDKFGQPKPAVPTVGEIDKVLEDAGNRYGSAKVKTTFQNYLAQAIVNYLEKVGQ